MSDQASRSTLKLSSKSNQSHEKLWNAIHFVTPHYVITQKMCECQMTRER